MPNKKESSLKIEQSILGSADRKITSTADTVFRPYDRYGAPNPDMDWLPLSGNAQEGYESFVLRMKPGVKSTPHIHTGGEEFYLLDGEMTDCDGTVFRTGDFVSYKPGSRHFSATENGCTLLVILHGENKRVE